MIFIIPSLEKEINSYMPFIIVTSQSTMPKKLFKAKRGYLYRNFMGKCHSRADLRESIKY
jgi:hypothetical protein